MAGTATRRSSVPDARRLREGWRAMLSPQLRGAVNGKLPQGFRQYAVVRYLTNQSNVSDDLSLQWSIGPVRTSSLRHGGREFRSFK